MPARSARYGKLTDFIAPAGQKTELWRTLAGLAIACAVYFLMVQLVLHMVLVTLGPSRGASALSEFSRGRSPAAVIELLFSYLVLTAGILLATTLMLGRGLGSLIGPLRPAWRNFLRVTLPLMAMWLALLPLSAAAPDVRANLSPAELLPWLVPALVGLFIQTGTEELLFRGYLQQQLAARFRSPWVWMGAPSLAFGALHYAPMAYGASAVFVVAWAMAFGLAAADLTARTGNLGAAVGLHFANNAATLLLVGLYGHLDGLTLFSTVVPPGDAWAQLPYVAIDSLSLLVGWLGARLILRV